jgi:hypothetical protein
MFRLRTNARAPPRCSGLIAVGAGLCPSWPSLYSSFTMAPKQASRRLVVFISITVSVVPLRIWAPAELLVCVQMLGSPCEPHTEGGTTPVRFQGLRIQEKRPPLHHPPSSTAVQPAPTTIQPSIRIINYKTFNCWLSTLPC